MAKDGSAAEGTRLQVILARAGIASRREAERMIAAGEVTVNGRVVTELGSKAKPDSDHIKVGGRLIPTARFKEYFVFNKPVRCVTTMQDPEGRLCVGDVVRNLGKALFPAGRLDYNSSGLLVLTNDGELAQRLTHPRHHVEKVYLVKTGRVASERMIERLRGGVRLSDGPTAPAFVRPIRQGKSRGWVEMRISEGRNQQVRRMFDAVGLNVEKLVRTALGPLKLGTLGVGETRRLREAELSALRAAVELGDAVARPQRKRRPAKKR